MINISAKEKTKKMLRGGEEEEKYC